MSRRASLATVGALGVLAAVLRFATLDRQSYWSDEAVTVLLTRLDLGELLRTVAETESTPPLYYLLAWLWTGVFGDGEIGLRSLSALAGVATVGVAYLSGSVLLGRRAGVAAAAVVAVSPPLVWYSQEARSYAWAVLLCGASFAAFAAALRRPAGRILAVWAAASVLAVWTHYFAAFVVGAEAVWLLAAARGRPVLRAVGGAAAGSLLVVPLALEQRGNGFAELIAASGGLAKRSVVVVKQLLVGHALPADRATAALVALLVAGSVAVLVARASRAQQRAALVAATVGGAALVVPIALAAVGLDYVNARNALVGFVPLAVAATAGLAVAVPPRIGAVAVGVLSSALLAVTVIVSIDRDYQRPDWRAVARALARPGGPRALVVAPDHQGWFARVPLQVYLPAAQAIDAGFATSTPQFADVSRRPQDRASPPSVRVDEVVLAGVGWPVPRPPRLPASFSQVEVVSGDGYELVRFRRPGPVSVPTASLAAPTAAVLVEP